MHASSCISAPVESLFHHIHHLENGEHKVHHCGGEHVKVDPKLDYIIEHCECGKHRISKQSAIGHATDASLRSVEVTVQFNEQCPEGGWHIESGHA